MIRKLFTAILILMLLLSITACGNKPSGEPKTILEQYNQNLIDGNVENAYTLLSSKNKSELSLEQFKDWQNVNQQLFKYISIKITKEEELKSYSFDGKEYEYATRYTLAYKDNDYITDKEMSSELQKLVVAENKEWKVLDEENYALKYASSLDYMGWAYREGKTFDQDVNTAISCFLKAIEIYPEYTSTYYDIAYAYSSKEQYDKALEYVIIGISKEQNNKEYISELYNIKGTILQAQGKYDEAKEAYKKAIDYNPSNVYANDNLDALE